MPELRLPSGEYTTDLDLFRLEWDEITKPFESLGFEIIGFDPGVGLCDLKTRNGPFTLPLYAAKRISNALKGTQSNDPDQRPGAHDS